MSESTLNKKRKTILSSTTPKPLPNYQEEVIKMIDASKFNQRHPKVGLFINKCKLTFPACTYLSIGNVNKLKEQINNAIDGIEGIRYEFHPTRDVWSLEFGTIPIQKEIDPGDFKLRRIINHKQMVALQVADKALEKFSHLREDVYYGSYERNLRWVKCIINLSYVQERRLILLEYVRIDGDSFTFYAIKEEIELFLKNNGIRSREKND